MNDDPRAEWLGEYTSLHWITERWVTFSVRVSDGRVSDGMRTAGKTPRFLNEVLTDIKLSKEFDTIDDETAEWVYRARNTRTGQVVVV